VRLHLAAPALSLLAALLLLPYPGLAQPASQAVVEVREARLAQNAAIAAWLQQFANAHRKPLRST
jgi:hypothetical protein